MGQYEPDEGDSDAKPSPKLAKDELKAQIVFYTKEKKNKAKTKLLKELDTEIKETESEIKRCRAEMKNLKALLELKLTLKRYGADDELLEANLLLEQHIQELEKLEKKKAA